MQNRERWGSKLGFILAAAGSAVGIGNIWKYPHMAGQNGGAAFTLVYLLCILVVGLSIVIAEFAIGRKTQLSPVGAFEMLAPGSNWKWVGFLGVASAFVILSFYGVVGGWIMKYVAISLTGGFEVLKNDPEAAEVLFGSFVSSTWGPVVWQVLFMAICVCVIVNGVKGGIEKWSKIMMPLIILLLIVLAVRGLVEGALGHVSARVSSDEIVIRCRGPHDGGLCMSDAGDVWRVTLDGDPVDLPEGYAAPKELPLHTELLRARPSLAAVVHAHPRSALLCGLAGLNVRPVFGAYNIPAMRLALRGVPIFPKTALVTRPELAREVVAAMAESDAGHGDGGAG